MTHAIEIANLAFSYQNQSIIEDISFSVEKESFFLIIGPNGSGKTTLVRLIAGIERLGKGRITLLGRSITAYSKQELARKIAFVPQAIPIDFPFTVRDIVLMGRAPHLGVMGFPGKKEWEIVEKAMGFTDVLALSRRRVSQLSGGERQRVFIARAICQEPEIILLDEPTAALDPAHQINIMNLMQRLKKEKGTTIVMVSHDLNLSSIYGERLLLLKKGEIIQKGPPREVLTETLLKKAYGCDLLVDESPYKGLPRITLVPGGGAIQI